MKDRAPAKRREIIIGGVLAVCCFSFFQLVLPYHLFFKEEIQLFLLTGEYFLSYWNKPAGLACYVGDFLTQFFYLRGGGAVTLSLTLWVEYIVTVQVLQRLGWTRYAAFVALLPVAADGYLHGSLYYGLSASVSHLFVLFVFLLYTRIKKPVWALAAGFLLIPFLYAAAGAACILFPVLALIYRWRKGERLWWYGVLPAVVAGVYPALVRPCYLQTAAQAYRYPYPSVFPARQVDSGREAILSLVVEAGWGRWDEVSRRAEAAGLAHPIATYYAHIASSKQGRLAENLLNVYQPLSGGLFLPVNPQSDWLSICCSNDVFYYLGDMNMARHSAMLGMIFSPRHRSSRMLRRLTEIHLACGDTAIARKYLRMLDATLFHRRWARKHDTLAPQPQPILAQDTLRTASDYIVSLERLIESYPENNPAVDYLLCYHLLNKDIAAFTASYNRYRKAQGGYIPRLYSEALLIRLAAEKAPIQELQSYGIPHQVIVDFMDYTRLYEQNKGASQPLRERFGNGYWFYYHFMAPQGTFEE
ncbi:MAG: DUF6057 family protein [Tannerellaceae bacterium]|jgi:hypothetical protein|nr:DUF6057 family protein [Tannerellaceae bacterium]